MKTFGYFLKKKIKTECFRLVLSFFDAFLRLCLVKVVVKGYGSRVKVKVKVKVKVRVDVEVKVEVEVEVKVKV